MRNLVNIEGVSPTNVDPIQWDTLTQAVGIYREIFPDYMEIKFLNEMLLLCSDGLTTMLSDDEIKRIFEFNNGDIEKISQELVEVANKKGGRDNISLIIIKK